MKKSLITGVASLALAATPVVSVFAETINLEADGYGDTHNVTVGEIDETVYSVDIEYGNFVFDWKYNAETNEYNFEAPKECQAFIYSGEDTEYKIYSDDTCNSLVSNPIGGERYYSKERVNDRLFVYDESENGKIKAQASFTPEEKYAWITGKIGEYTYYANGDDANFIEYEDGILQIRGSRGLASAYRGELKLEKNVNHPINAEYGPMLEGDVIGTITIEISPDTTPISN